MLLLLWNSIWGINRIRQLGSQQNVIIMTLVLSKRLSEWLVLLCILHYQTAIMFGARGSFSAQIVCAKRIKKNSILTLFSDHSYSFIFKHGRYDFTLTSVSY